MPEPRLFPSIGAMLGFGMMDVPGPAPSDDTQFTRMMQVLGVAVHDKQEENQNHEEQ